MSIGSNIKAFREDRKLTQEQVAEALGISFQAVSSWERDEYNPDTDKLECYDEAVDCVEAWQSGKPCDAIFQDLGGGRALYEAGGETIELEYDLLGPES